MSSEKSPLMMTNDREIILDLTEYSSISTTRQTRQHLWKYVYYTIGFGCLILLFCTILHFIYSNHKYIVEPQFIFHPPPPISENNPLLPEYQMIKQSHMLNTDFIEERCDKIKYMNRLIEIRHDIAEEFHISYNNVDETMWAQETNMSIEQLNKIIHDSELAKRELLSFNRRILSKWLISQLPGGKHIPWYDMIEFGMNEIIIAVDLYDSEIHGDFQTYLTYIIDDSYQDFYETFLIEGNYEISNIDKYISPEYVFFHVNMNIAYSLVKMMMTQYIQKFTNITETDRFDLIYVLENTFHPLEFNLLSMEYGLKGDRYMEIEEIRDLMEITPDTFMDIISKMLKKSKSHFIL